MRGSITVFMSLCLAVSLLFVGTLLESARIYLIRSQILRCTEASLDSLFAEYDGELFDEFGVLLLNMYELGDENGIEQAVKSEINEQLGLNSDRTVIGGNLARADVGTVQVAELYPAIYGDGKLFARSVLDYMKYRIPVSMTADVLEKLNLIREGEEAVETAKEAEQQEEKLLENSVESEVMDEELIRKYEELADESILKKMEVLRDGGYMELLLPSESILSEKTTTKGGFPSNYYAGTTTAEENLLQDLANNLLYCEYLLEHFSGFTQECENPVLSYELEYILCGNGSDRRNLEECAGRLLLMREGLNMLAIYRNQSLSVQADAFAATLAGWTGIAPLVELVKTVIVGVWAYAESIVDVRTLLSGYPVPFVKEEGEWLLALEQVAELIKGAYLKTGQYDEGLEYPDYIRLMLLMTNEQDKYFRTMDMIQCRISEKKPRFYMSECLYALEVEVTAEAAPVFLNPFGQRNWNDGYYVIKTNASRMY